MRLLLGDCLDKLKELDDNSIDSIVTDPPYGLSFMGKKWDYDVPKKKVWKECMRVLKPGGYLLAFAGSRTYHQMAYRIEKSGFEIRDQIMWIYGSGFPKSLNIGKGIDKKNGQSKIELKFVEWYRTVGISAKETNKIIGTTDTGSHYLRLDQPYLPTKELWKKLKPHIKIEIPDWVDELIERVEAKREIIEKKRVQRNSKSWHGNGIFGVGEQNFDITTPATDEAKQWEGWGTALKPAHEPIVMARKPLSEKTVVDNVLEWGTGGINIDECRIGTEKVLIHHAGSSASETYGWNKGDKKDSSKDYYENEGRFPANVIFDEEAGKILDEQSGITKSGDFTQKGQSSNTEQPSGWKTSNREFKVYKGDSGGASRFFYCPKTSKTDRNEGLEDFEEKKSRKWRDDKGMKLTGSGNPRNEMSKNFHPTVKPTDLMLYLIRMVTPKGGTTLDPFMGSGSTGKAAVRGGFNFVGIEREEEYMEIATARIQYEQDNPYNEEKGERIKINKNANKFW